MVALVGKEVGGPCVAHRCLKAWGAVHEGTEAVELVALGLIVGGRQDLGVADVDEAAKPRAMEGLHPVPGGVSAAAEVWERSQGIVLKVVILHEDRNARPLLRPQRAGLGWARLGWAGLGWVGLGWAGLGWAGFELGWVGLGWAGLGSNPTWRRTEAPLSCLQLEGLRSGAKTSCAPPLNDPARTQPLSPATLALASNLVWRRTEAPLNDPGRPSVLPLGRGSQIGNQNIVRGGRLRRL